MERTFMPNKLLDVIGVSRENMNALICQWALISMCEQAVCSVLPEECSVLMQCFACFCRAITIVNASEHGQNITGNWDMSGNDSNNILPAPDASRSGLRIFEFRHLGFRHPRDTFKLASEMVSGFFSGS